MFIFKLISKCKIKLCILWFEIQQVSSIVAAFTASAAAAAVAVAFDVLHALITGKFNNVLIECQPKENN